MINFFKYQGTGNDFIMIDNRSALFDASNLKLIQELCDRRFGIGADGLILLERDLDADFYVNYFNADGSKSFCGNGARCAVRFASDLGIINDKTSFNAIDGRHEALVYENTISLKMGDVDSIEHISNDTFVLDTGSPHYIKFTEDLNGLNIVNFGKSIRYSPEFEKEGINVNVAQENEGEIDMLTYERGVEDETFSCGTGATAVALAFQRLKKAPISEVFLNVKGGRLKVRFETSSSGYHNIWLEGPAQKVYEGRYE